MSDKTQVERFVQTVREKVSNQLRAEINGAMSVVRQVWVQEAVEPQKSGDLYEKCRRLGDEIFEITIEARVAKALINLVNGSDVL
jgi:hypothetical protein